MNKTQLEQIVEQFADDQVCLDFYEGLVNEVRHNIVIKPKEGMEQTVSKLSRFHKTEEWRDASTQLIDILSRNNLGIWELQSVHAFGFTLTEL